MAPAGSSVRLSPAELSYIHTSLASDPPIRPDARLANDFRAFSAETGVLPNTMGSAHVGFADGREAVVGVRAEVERTVQSSRDPSEQIQDTDMTDASATKEKTGRSSWVTLSLSLPGLRDDDKDLVFLEEMLRETLVMPGTSEAPGLTAALMINARWHWHLFVDVVLISPPETAAGSYPVPLLSMAINLALRDTRLPRLKSEGEEDPLADDDWEASSLIYKRTNKQKYMTTALPSVTLLVVVVGDNVLFDPSSTELAVADAILAVSISADAQDPTHGAPNLLAVRMLETTARDTMKGVPRAEGGNAWDVVPGVWRPKVGGVKRAIMSQVVKAAMGDVGREVLQGLESFVDHSG